jgi:hypothetical protein
VPVPDTQGVSRDASAQLWGLVPLRWQEYPFDWVRSEWYAVRRAFTRGPIAQFRGGLELVPTAMGTHVRAFADLTPRGPWARPVAAYLGHRGVRATLGYCAQCVWRAQTHPEAPLPRDAHHRVARGVLDRLLARLRSATAIPAALIECFSAHLVDGTDDEVLRMRPYALATQWGVDRLTVLRLFLYATCEGLLQLDWELMCPNCRAPKAE